MNGISAAPPIRASAPASAGALISQRAREAVGLGALVSLTLAGAAFAATAAGGRSFVVPASHGGLPTWMAGPLHGLAPVLTADQSTLLLAFMLVAWAGVLVFGPTLRARWVVGAIGLLHLIFTISPPVLSKDIFSYITYARLAVLHGVNPYTAVAARFPADPAFPYTGWTHTGSAYGQLFQVASYPLALVGVPAAMWIIKAVTAAASLGLVWLVWRCAERLGRPPVAAAIWVGLNPILLVYGVGGGHNDLIMLFLMVGAVLLVLDRREAGASVSLVAAAAVKASAVVALPFLFLRSPRKLSTVAGAAAAAIGVLVVATLAFAGHPLGVVSVLRQQQLLVSGDAIPNQLAHLFGLGGVTSDVRLATRLLTLTALGGLAWLVWRRALDWITATGWAMVTLVLASSWMLGWYVLWPLPFAALSRDRRLHVAAFALVAYFVAMRWDTFIR
jgi:hypothetical protein